MEGRKVMNMKRFVALIMAFVMVLLVSVPTFAVAPYTITITSAYTGHTYEAYQIFTGTLDSTETTLSDVEWGSNVDSSSLLAALKADSTYGSLFTNCTEAADVAKVLSDNNTNDALAEWFAQTASEYLTGTAFATSDETSTGNYEIEVSAAGYYLIKDQDVTTAGDSYTDIILWVSADENIVSKSVYPSVTKSVDEEDVSIGDTVTYTITGYVPDTSAYSAYTYVFTDTLAAGLTYDDTSLSIVAYTAQDVPLASFVSGTDYYTLDSGTFTKVANTSVTPDSSTTYYVMSTLVGSGTDYSVGTTGGSGSDTTITITMTNAKSLSKSYLIVTYEAELNSSAVIGNDGNTNSVKVTYSNNPNVSDPTTATNDTPNAEVVTFTYELDITKVDGQTTSTTLPGAEFILYKDVYGTPYYAIATDNSDGTYTITGWTDDDTAAQTLVSYSDGSIKVIGLDAGEYSLKETKAPDGYNTITNAIEIEIAATYEDTDSDGLDEVETLTITVNGGTATDGNTSTGVVTMDVENNAGSVMPSTGGIGVTVYVVGGLVLIVAALGVMMAVKVKGKKNGN